MEFHRQQRFSIRKYAIGVASVLIGTFLMSSAVSADTIVPTPSVVEPSVVVPETAATDEKQQNHFRLLRTVCPLQL